MFDYYTLRCSVVHFWYNCLQIDEVLRDEDRAEAISGHIDKLLLMLSMQFRMAHSTHMSNPNVSREDVVRLYRCLLSTMLDVSILALSWH